ncbi:MAG: hypothetical protein IPO03_01835 [Bacteroidetes bacterium]|nr:hypothetical protein [Bacteroidota bacterium]
MERGQKGPYHGDEHSAGNQQWVKTRCIDIQVNTKGHEYGIIAIQHFRNIVLNVPVNNDSITFHYFNLFRDFVSVQNNSGYETLKSKGLEIINNDSLRSKIIALYEGDYNTIRKLEEEYDELQFQENYYKDFNTKMSPYYQLDSLGTLKDMTFPVALTTSDKNQVLSDFWKMQNNRVFIIQYYLEVEKRIKALQAEIDKELH